MTSLASQGEMNTFIREKASQRKTILTNFLDLTLLDKMNDVAKKTSNALRAEARHLSDNNWKKKIESLALDMIAQEEHLSVCRDDIKRTKALIDSLIVELHESTSSVYVDA